VLIDCLGARVVRNGPQLLDRFVSGYSQMHLAPHSHFG
jgi:hypothetical protein